MSTLVHVHIYLCFWLHRWWYATWAYGAHHAIKTGVCTNGVAGKAAKSGNKNDTEHKKDALWKEYKN